MGDITMARTSSRSAKQVTLGDRIKHVRTLRELTQEELSEMTGISQRQISRYESGDNNPTAQKLELVAKALRVSTAYLMGSDEDMQDEFAEEYLSPLERKLIEALRSGRLHEALDSFTTLSNKSN